MIIKVKNIDALEEQRLKTNKQIKPCPFCGSHNVEQRERYNHFTMVTDAEEYYFWIGCNECFASSVCDSDINQVIAAWNRRDLKNPKSEG